MIEFQAVKSKIREYLFAHSSVDSAHLAGEGSLFVPDGGLWVRETFYEFTLTRPAQFSCRADGSVVYEILQPSDRDFREAEALRQDIADLFQPPLLISGEGFYLQTTRLVPFASRLDRAWNIAALRIHFSAYPV
ncbi:MAG TPA: hypothetical protein DDZ11_11675 [Lentisphaeria bacterium]|nr:hypothetical protein [Lentisphaeria bacterium]